MRYCLYDTLGFFTAYFLYPYAEHKRGRKILPKLSILRKEAKQPFAQRKQTAQAHLVKILECAQKNVPYYRDLFATYNFSPQSVLQDVRYLTDLPFLTKEIILEQGKRLLNESCPKILHERKTGGSTGPAANIYYSKEDLDWTAAQNIQMLEWGGKHRFNREAHLSTLFLKPLPDAAIREEIKKCLVLNRYNIYTSGLGAQALRQLYKSLQKAHARFVQGHPSSMAALAQYLVQQGAKTTGLFQVFVSTGEMLTNKQRKLIENVFQCRVSNRYGACEFGVMAQELTRSHRGKLLVADSMVWPELLDPNPEGIGELVFTSLRNESMPLIRYRIGDIGQLIQKDDGWWISNLTGRIHDSVIIGGDTYPTHYVQDILDRCGPISDFQIVVKDSVAQELCLVCAQENWSSIFSAVTENFPTVPLRRICTEELVLTGRREKFRYVIKARK